MKMTETIKQSFKRGSEFVVNVAVALDASPSETLQAEIRELKRELTELQRQVGRRATRQQSAARVSS